jgi:hypothetical protein
VSIIRPKLDCRCADEEQAALSDDQSPAWVMEACRLLANSQALLLANLAHGLAQALGADPGEVARAMETLDMCHRDERVEVLAAGMRRTMLRTLRAGVDPQDLNQPW